MRHESGSGKGMSNKVDVIPIRQVQRFFVGLGASVAGISAMLYACGYLVSRGHLHALGLYGLVEESADAFLQEGGKFAFVTGYVVLRTTLAFIPILGLGAVLALVLWSIGRRPRIKLVGIRLGQILGRWLPAPWPRRILYALALGVLVWHLDQSLDAAQAPALVSNLLFTAPSGVNQSAIADNVPITPATIKAALLVGDTQFPGSIYSGLLFSTTFAVALAAVAWWVVEAWRLKLLALLPFLLGGATFVLMLPFDYGVLERAMQFPRVVLHLLPDKSGASDAEGFLVQKNSDGVLVWDPVLHRLSSVPQDQVQRMDILGNERLFGARLAGTGKALGE